MSQSSFEVTAIKENTSSSTQPPEAQLAEEALTDANLLSEEPDGPADSGAKRGLADSDEVESPPGKRFSADYEGDSDCDSGAKLTAEAAPVADQTSDNLDSSSHHQQQQPIDSITSGGNHQQMSQTIEHSIPDRLVGLMIGKGGESINRLQEESGARIQISTESSGPLRQVTLTGTQEQVDRARQLMDTIVHNAERGSGSGDSASHGGGGGGGRDGGASAGQETLVMQVPSAKVGLLIGKAGETIKSLQDKAGVRMLLVQDSTTSVLPEKPLKIIGAPDRLNYARELVQDLLNSKDNRSDFSLGGGQRGGGGGGMGSVGVFEMRGSSRGSGGGGSGGGGMNFGDTYQEMKVPRRCVGVVIGKGGDMLRKINQETGAKVQFRQEGPADRDLPERMLQVSGSSSAVQAAMERVQHLINAVLTGEIPVTERPRGPESRTVTYAVPAEKAGLVIGKGGETIKDINRISGAYVAIQRDSPPNGTTKVFDVQGSPGQIAEAIRLICEKAGLPHSAASAGVYGNGGGGDGMAAAGAGGQELPGPQYNSQTGQLDYSMAWAEYYRRQGMHEYADAILRQAASGGHQQPQQQQDPQWQQYQQWQAWQQNGGAAAGAGQAAAGQQAQAAQGQQAWGAWQQQQAAAAAAVGAWDHQSAAAAAAAAAADPAWGQQAAQQAGQQPADAGQQQSWWYGNTSGR